jgi:hypothetical protein
MLCFILLFLSAGLSFRRKWLSALAAFMLGIIAFLTHIGAYLPLFFTLSIEAPQAVKAGEPVPVQVTMNTWFFTSTFGCASKRAYDTGRFIGAIPHPGAPREIAFASGMDIRDWPRGALYDPAMFEYKMIRVTDEEGNNVPQRHTGEDRGCRIPYSIWPDVTIKEMIDISSRFDLHRPGVYRIEAVYSRTHSNIATVKVTQ